MFFISGSWYLQTMMSQSKSTSSYSSSSSEKDNNLSSDNEENATRHERGIRLVVNRRVCSACPRTDKIPVYCFNRKKESDATKATLSPRSLIIDGANGRMVMTNCNSSNNVTLMSVVSTGPLADMSGIRKVTKNGKIIPSAILFENVSPQDVWILFKFYKEITGDTAVDSMEISEAIRTTQLDMKDSANNAIFDLATLLGADVFINTLSSTSLGAPEEAIIKTIVQHNQTHLDSQVSYVVIPRLTVNKYVPPLVPAVVLDGTYGVYEANAKNILKSIMQKKKETVVDPDEVNNGINYMSMATYINLTRLYEVNPSPRLVVFSNVDPAAVWGMIRFYENIIHPSDKTSSIYSVLGKLDSQKLGSSVYKDWLILAKKSGATAFSTILRRNL